LIELFDRAAEEIVIIGALVDPNELDEMLATLQPQHFYAAGHEKLWRGLGALRQKGVALDEISPALLRPEVNDDAVMTTLDDAIRNVPSAYGWKRHAARVIDFWRRRAAIQQASTLIDTMQKAVADPAAEIARASNALIDLTTGSGGADPRNVADFVTEAQEASKNGGMGGVPAPWSGLNDITTGWKPGQLIVTAAGTGVGKSAFAAAIAAHNLEAGVLMFSLEMTGREVASRIICMKAGVDSRKYDAGTLGAADRSSADEAAQALQGNFWIDDTAGTDVTALRSKALRWVAKHGIGLVIVDYLGLVDEKIDGANRVQIVGAISRGLKMLAMECKVPVLALHQLNRDSAKEKREPQLHDLRDSGNVEQDANQVILLHRESQNEQTGLDTIKVRVAKNRGGPVSSIKLHFRRTCTRFEVIDTKAAVERKFAANPYERD
jgi:replicative DNA helicase